jgi:hypothetical protein
MLVPMMHIRRMAMFVAQWFVIVGVAMGLARRHHDSVSVAVLVMFVVGVHVFVRHRLVLVLMAMLFTQQQRYTGGHDHHRCDGITADAVAEDHNRR